jgi:excisionase family DNA binding protein
MMSEQRLKTVRQAAYYLNVSERHIYDMLYARELKSIKIGRLHRIPIEELERWATEEIEKQWATHEAREGRGEHIQA